MKYFSETKIHTLSGNDTPLDEWTHSLSYGASEKKNNHKNDRCDFLEH